MRPLLLPLLVLAALAVAPAAVAQPGNDSYYDAVLLYDTPGPHTYTGTNVEATLESGEAAPSCQPAHGASVWWVFSAPSDGTVSIDVSASDFDTIATLYINPSSAFPTEADEVACDDDGGTGTRSLLSEVPIEGEAIYFLRVSGYAGRIGTISFDVTFAGGPPPANDDFSSAFLATVDGTTTGSNVLASGESGEVAPTCQGNDAASVWWLFEAPADGAVTVDLSGSTFDTVVALYNDTYPTLPTTAAEIACNDDAPGVETSLVEGAPVRAGGVYYIRVTGVLQARGDIEFDLTFTPDGTSAPPNDDVASPSFPAIPITTGTNAGATVEPDEVVPSCQSAQGASVWWSFRWTGGNLVTMDFSASDFDTVVTLYEAPASGGLNEIACDDDGGDGTRSRLTELRLSPGIDYYLRVAGYDNGGGGGPATGQISFETTSMPATSNEADAAAALALTAWPNPARGTSRVRLVVDTPQEVTVAVYDAMGRRVAVLHEGAARAGTPVELTLRTEALPSGVYVVRATGPSLRLSERVTVVR